MLLALVAAVVASVSGTVAIGGGPAPGVAVKLHGGSYAAEQITDVHGGYAFENVPTGTYEVTIELSGLRTETRSVRVAGGTNVVPPVEMKVTGTRCSTTISFCSDTAPPTRYDRPLCSEYNLDVALIESAKRGDRSAVELLRQHYETTFTYDERYLIAAVLLGRVRDDRAIWNELSEHAERIVAAGGDGEKLEAYCAAHGYDVDQYQTLAWSAFSATFEDRRARPLLLRALESENSDLAEMGVLGLSMQPDAPPLAELEAAVKRHPELALDLGWFHSAVVDALADKYLKDEAERAAYRDRAK